MAKDASAMPAQQQAFKRTVILDYLSDMLRRHLDGNRVADGLLLVEAPVLHGNPFCLFAVEGFLRHGLQSSIQR